MEAGALGVEMTNSCLKLIALILEVFEDAITRRSTGEEGDSMGRSMAKEKTDACFHIARGEKGRSAFAYF